jgi:hypothetical protein
MVVKTLHHSTAQSIIVKSISTSISTSISIIHRSITAFHRRQASQQ